jgi:hypothetical protein
MRPLLAILIPAALLLPPPANAWGNEGHQVVARIAAAHLTPAALKRVSELLDVENEPAAVAEALASAAIWADQVKTETNTENWHFVDLAWQDTRANFGDRCAGDDCALARVLLFTAQLKAADPELDSRFNDLDALRFLVHLVADLHQPLHVASNADEGGECETLDPAIGDAANLHSLWDSELVSQLGPDDTVLAADLNAEIAEMTDAERAAFSSGDPEDWAWEAHRLALINVYKRLDIPKQPVASLSDCSDAPAQIQQLHLQIDDKYLEDMQPVVREQLIKAGLRLAKLLNNIL